MVVLKTNKYATQSCLLSICIWSKTGLETEPDSPRYETWDVCVCRRGVSQCLSLNKPYLLLWETGP